jgi:hypothetical protein
VVQRKAVPGTSIPQGAGGYPARKPLSGTLAPVENYANRQNVNAGSYAQKPGMLAPEYASRQSYDQSQYQQQSKQPVPSPHRSPERRQPVGTSLTLIRRDPSSGAQWNVARIDDPSIIEVCSSKASESGAKRQIGAPMWIDVTNPGYSKFLHTDDTGKAAISTPPSNRSSQSYLTGTASELQTSVPYPENPTTGNLNVFRRRLWMEGTQYTSGGFGHRKNGSYDFNTGRPGSRDSYDARTDRSSLDTRPAPSPSFLTRDDQTYSTIQLSDRQTSFRGYVFTSPWNGRCEFVTGAGGGSLKVRLSLVYNPACSQTLTINQCRHIVPGLQGAPPAAMSVSELRFNLPSRSIPPTPKGEESSKRSSFFHRGRHSRNNSSLSVNKDDTENLRSSLDRLDLSLGQEFAGGGFGGKQAKLGKIIVEDEGLKMMDLLVAANLALWWRAYEKASTPSRGDRGSV